MSVSVPVRVVVAGGGIAAAELVLALSEIAGERVKATLVSPDPNLVIRPLRTAEPFAPVHVRRHPLSALSATTGAEVVQASAVGVDGERKRLLLEQEEAIEYDVVVLATGARAVDPYEGVMTFRGDRSSIPYSDLVSDIKAGFTKSLALIVPPGPTWPLPIYELALLTARATEAVDAEVELMIVSPEPKPLAMFGPAASAAVSELLRRADISFAGSIEVSASEDGTLVTAGGRELAVDRVVSLPRYEGRLLDGVPADMNGFIPIDDHCRVLGLTAAFAIGDGSSNPFKQGGIACQAADAVAEQIAAVAGADVTPQPFKPVLRGRVLTGATVRYLGEEGEEVEDVEETEQPLLFAGARKVEGRYLSSWLAELEGVHPDAHIVRPGQDETIDVDISVPATDVQPRDE